MNLFCFVCDRHSRACLRCMRLWLRVQEGAIALHLAVERYDPGRGVRFFTYADWSLRAAFEKAVSISTLAVMLSIPRLLRALRKYSIRAMGGVLVLFHVRKITLHL